jgi:predicted lipoprotein with Yx(FWY)xxD motif
MFILVACGSQVTPAPTEEAQQVEEEQKEAEKEVVEEPAVRNAVRVVDQELGSGNTVTVASVTADAAGWLVIHAQADGSPGPILGFAPVDAGENSDVVVDIDAAGATETLYAMLHVDAGVEGEYEFPGDDGPAADAEGHIVTPPFSLTIPNSVTATDQTLGEDNTLTIAEVVSSAPGWMVIHAQADGSPGAVLGFAPVSAGYNSDVLVEIDSSGATETLYAMLHVDAGNTGEYEFPGQDVPATDSDGNVVTPPFQIDLRGVNAVSVTDQTLGEGNTFTIAAVRSADPGWIVIHAQVDDSPGPILGITPVAAGANENVVVRIDIDDLSDVLYAMLHVDAGTAEIFEFPTGDDVPATDSEGNVVAPSFNRLPSTVEIGYNEELGAFLVGANGLTLYLFTKDEEGESTCYDQCADAWPPLLVEEGESPSAGPDVDGDLVLIIKRTDGTLQVSYNGMPLYFFAGDESPGDANGHTSGDVWFVIEP